MLGKDWWRRKAGARVIGKTTPGRREERCAEEGGGGWSRIGPPSKGADYKDPSVHCPGAVTRG